MKCSHLVVVLFYPAKWLAMSRTRAQVFSFCLPSHHVNETPKTPSVPDALRRRHGVEQSADTATRDERKSSLKVRRRVASAYVSAALSLVAHLKGHCKSNLNVA